MSTPDEIRFSSRPVGVELEIPEHTGGLEVLVRDYGWEMQQDDSIPGEGVEAVTPPIHGDAIREQINRFYSICKRAGVSTEHYTCGTHVHINAVDIYSFVGQSPKKEELENRVHEWGMVVAGLSRLFVGPRRNGTRFASGGFAIRGNHSDPPALKKLRRINYPTLAIRDNTFEFRIFPSTAEVRFTLARIAFCQAAGDWIYKHLKLSVTTFQRRLAVISAPLDSPEAFMNAEIVRTSLTELGVDTNAIEILMGIYAKFLPGNKECLPALWEAERNRIIRMECDRRAYIEGFQASFERYNTPQILVEFLTRELELPEPVTNQENTTHVRSVCSNAPRNSHPG